MQAELASRIADVEVQPLDAYHLCVSSDTTALSCFRIEPRQRCTGTKRLSCLKPSGRCRSSHPGITEQHGFKVLRITADIHLLEVIVPTRRGDLPLKFALKLDVRPRDRRKRNRTEHGDRCRESSCHRQRRRRGGLQTFDRFDYFPREIGSLAFRAFGPGGTVVIEFDKDPLHDATLLKKKKKKKASVVDRLLGKR